MESIRRRKPSLKPIETKGKATEAAEEEPLSPSARLFHEPNFNVHVIGIMGLKSRITPQVVKEHLPHTLLKHPRFSSLQDTNTPFKGCPGSEFNPRRVVYGTVSLDDMKLVKNALNMTVTDVALGVTQAGLSIYLNRRYGEGKKDKGATEKNNNLPKNIRLRSTILMNLRPSVGIQALADMMDENTEAKWGNCVGYVLLPFKIALRDDPLDYLREAKATIDRKKNSLEAIYTFSTSELALKLFGIKASSSISHRIITNTTMCFSCLPGPQEEIGFYGHPLAYIAPGSYGQPHALMINCQSYINKMTIVLSVDESVIPDPHQLADDFEQSLKLIKDAVVERGLCHE
ncbi:wax ester synthase/diacylglycerol acyltransferase 5-like isoform X3 [Lycium barbarum]|uniref:wax ester synthase/diacylglycerol acyltransferase 5-like isoform X3 n=1 Tax=Lycium barbarum TaxID=112863 RepID=UPI00293E9FB2|nr:wax ester synthase/diacylglycerol acyltransferase 5-like isoform X3 [Lycium barbarum]